MIDLTGINIEAILESVETMDYNTVSEFYRQVGNAYFMDGTENPDLWRVFQAAQTRKNALLGLRLIPEAPPDA